MWTNVTASQNTQINRRILHPYNSYTRIKNMCTLSECSKIYSSKKTMCVTNILWPLKLWLPHFWNIYEFFLILCASLITVTPTRPLQEKLIKIIQQVTISHSSLDSAAIQVWLSKINFLMPVLESHTYIHQESINSQIYFSSISSPSCEKCPPITEKHNKCQISLWTVSVKLTVPQKS